VLAHKILGTVNQMVVVQLEPGQCLYADRGTFRWKTVNVSLETRLTTPKGNQAGAPAAAGGFLAKAMDVGKRVLAGESLAFQYYRANGGSGLVTFAGVLPGEMRALELDGTIGWYAEKDAFAHSFFLLHGPSVCALAFRVDDARNAVERALPLLNRLFDFKREIEARTGFETRMTILGHVQRGGTPTAYDRVLATRFGVKAVEAADRGEWGTMVSLRGTDIVQVPLADAVAELKLLDDDLYDTAEVFFG